MRPEFFVSDRQVPDGIAFDPMLLLRTTGYPAARVETVRAMIREVDPMLVLDSVMTMEDRVMTSLARPRAYALVLGGLAALALMIAGVGLFGMLSDQPRGGHPRSASESRSVPSCAISSDWCCARPLRSSA